MIGNVPQNCGRSAADVIAEARRWIGTPYHHQATLRGVGCDCLGLVRGIWRKVVGPEPIAMPNYSPAWDEVSKRDDMANLFAEHLAAADRAPIAGDVILFRMRPEAVAKHCGVMVSASTFVHSHTGRGTVEIDLNDYWRGKLAGVFTFPGIA